jgi:hypothetical protein
VIYCVHVQALQAVRAVGDETSLAKLTIKRRQDGIVRAVAELSPGPDLLLQLPYLGCCEGGVNYAWKVKELSGSPGPVLGMEREDEAEVWLGFA